MELLILSKNCNTRYKLCRCSIYKVGDITNGGWTILYHGYYDKNRFLTREELEKRGKKDLLRQQKKVLKKQKLKFKLSKFIDKW